MGGGGNTGCCCGGGRLRVALGGGANTAGDARRGGPAGGAGAKVWGDWTPGMFGNGDMIGCGLGVPAALVGRFGGAASPATEGASFHPGISRLCAAGIGAGESDPRARPWGGGAIGAWLG